jgi:5-methylcytosine-specific restriction endonuclease McrA
VKRNGVVIDHLLNRRQHPEHALNPDLLVAVCHACNTKKAVWTENSSKQEIGADGLPEGW